MSKTGLYVVATPIGNLEDMTSRGVRVLQEVELIAAEDTRRSRLLLDHYSISTPMQALHEHNEARVVDGILRRIADGAAVALIADAGTPLISDPGYRLVGAAQDAVMPVYTVPGPSAVTAALSVAGLPTDRFAFEGFLPARAQARRKKLISLADEMRTLVFFESSHRVVASIADMAEILGPGRLAALCRELTKKFETVVRAPLADLGKLLADDVNQRRGEFVVVVAGHEREAGEDLDRARQLFEALQDYLPASQAARVAAKISGVPRRKVYGMHKQ